jgi:AcrR family transcriptional regulator
VVRDHTGSAPSTKTSRADLHARLELDAMDPGCTSMAAGSPRHSATRLDRAGVLPSAPGKTTAPTRVDEIYRVAVTLFLERGYDATPLSLIAQELGLTKAGLYHHFASKEQLLFDIHRDRMRDSLEPIIERAESEPDPAVRLDRYLREFSAMMGSDPAIRLLIDESKRLSASHLEEIESVWRRGYRVMRRSIEELQAAGRCDPTLNATYAAFAAIGMCAWTLYWFDHERPRELSAVAADFATIFRRGLATDAAPGLFADRSAPPQSPSRSLGGRRSARRQPPRSRGRRP